MVEFLLKGIDEKGCEREFAIDGESEQEVIGQAESFGFSTTSIRAISPAEAEVLRVAEEIRAVEALRDAEEQREELRREEYRSAIERLAKSIESGRRLFMYRKHLLTIDSDIEGHQLAEVPDLRELQRLGLDSWEVTGVVARTTGTSLQNDVFESIFTVGKAHAGGIGGMVNGAYVLLRKEILLADLAPEPTDDVKRYVLDCL